MKYEIEEPAPVAVKAVIELTPLEGILLRWALWDMPAEKFIGHGMTDDEANEAARLIRVLRNLATEVAGR